ncbi:MAG: NepR family anti-sigma factor [Erythrobacter sp.]
MSQASNSGGKSPHSSPVSKDAPEWADGLRKLYDSVVEEPLPDSFTDLLSKLDEPKGSDQA